MNIPINQIIQGDGLEQLKKLSDECVDLIITSPPYYGLRDYQVKGQIGLEKTFEQYLEKMLAITYELKRVLKPMGQFWLNMGDCYASHTFGQSKTGGGIQKKVVQEANQYPRWVNKSKFYQDKCLFMQPERLAIAMIDRQGWILRNKIKWAKQVLLYKKRKTIGSVMPSSVKDRFNESGEELYFFVKNKKYYSDLDAVRLPHQVIGVTDMKDAGILRQRMYPESKYNKRPYKPTNFVDSGLMYKKSKYKDKSYQGKFTNKQDAEKYNSPRARTQRNWQKEEAEGYKMGSVDPHRAALRGKRNKVNDPRGNHEGGPGSWRDNLDDQEYRKRWKDQSKKESKIEQGFSMGEYYRQNPEQEQYDIYPKGKNLPTIWQIGSEPHNFSKELGIDSEHFAIFPQALLEIPIKFGCPKNGIVLDPFMGSGTTALVARKLGRNYIGIELSEKYIEIAKKRLAQSVLL